jgi:uncharacterized coiled-coil protein SlyX
LQEQQAEAPVIEMKMRLEHL